MYLVIQIDKEEVRLLKGKSVKDILNKNEWAYTNVLLYKAYDDKEKALEFMKSLI